jgi:hypothetical protein
MLAARSWQQSLFSRSHKKAQAIRGGHPWPPFGLYKRRMISRRGFWGRFSPRVIDSRLPRLAVRIAFPHGSPSMQAADWNQIDKHQTRIISDEKDRALIRRELRFSSDKLIVPIALRHSLPPSLLSPIKPNGEIQFWLGICSAPILRDERGAARFQTDTPSGDINLRANDFWSSMKFGGFTQTRLVTSSFDVDLTGLTP